MASVGAPRPLRPLARLANLCGHVERRFDRPRGSRREARATRENARGRRSGRCTRSKKRKHRDMFHTVTHMVPGPPAEIVASHGAVVAMLCFREFMISRSRPAVIRALGRRRRPVSRGDSGARLPDAIAIAAALLASTIHVQVHLSRGVGVERRASSRSMSRFETRRRRAPLSKAPFWHVALRPIPAYNPIGALPSGYPPFRFLKHCQQRSTQSFLDASHFSAESEEEQPGMPMTLERTGR